MDQRHEAARKGVGLNRAEKARFCEPRSTFPGDIHREYASACPANDLEDLAGIRVGHHMEAIEEGDDIILTLKDRGILDDEERKCCGGFPVNGQDTQDELVSTALIERERLKKNLENKVKKPKYDPYAEEFDPTSGMKKILSKYDDDSEEKNRRVRSSFLSRLIS